MVEKSIAVVGNVAGGCEQWMVDGGGVGRGELWDALRIIYVYSGQFAMDGGRDRDAMTVRLRSAQSLGATEQDLRSRSARFARACLFPS